MVYHYHELGLLIQPAIKKHILIPAARNFREAIHFYLGVIHVRKLDYVYRYLYP